MMEFADRAARNEEIFKNVNRGIVVGAERHSVSSPLPFHCECADASCLATLSISVADYERGAGKRYCFFVVPGHQNARVERVVEEHENFLVVEKVGEARAQIDQDNSETSVPPAT